MKEEKETINRRAIASVEPVSWNVMRAQIRTPTELTKDAAMDLKR